MLWREKIPTSISALAHTTHTLHTTESQHFTCKSLHCQTPASLGPWSFRKMKTSCSPLQKKPGTTGMKGHYARPSAQALPIFNSIINRPHIYIPCFLQPTVGAILLTNAKHHLVLGMCSWMLVSSLLKIILALLSIGLWDPHWGNPRGFEEGRNPSSVTYQLFDINKLFDCSQLHFLHLKMMQNLPHRIVVKIIWDAHEVFIQCLVLTTGSVTGSNLHQKSMWVLSGIFQALFDVSQILLEA